MNSHPTHAVGYEQNKKTKKKTRKQSTTRKNQIKTKPNNQLQIFEIKTKLKKLAPESRLKSNKHIVNFSCRYRSLWSE